MKKGAKCFITVDGQLRENPKVCSLLSYDRETRLWYVQVHEEEFDRFCYVNSHLLRPVVDNMKPFEAGELVEYSRDGVRFKQGVVTKVKPLKIKGKGNCFPKSYQFVRHPLPKIDLLNHNEDISNPLRLLPPPRKKQPKCQICLFDCIDPAVLHCGHRYCRVCLKNFMESKISDGHFDLKCFHISEENIQCGEHITEAEIKSLVGGTFWRKREKWRMREQLGNSAAECPFCEHVERHQVGVRGRANIHHCSKCDKEFCVKHGTAHPTNVSCRSFECTHHKKSMKTVSRTCQVCPGCNERIEKSSGCNHMTCSKCRTHFCFLCGQKICRPYMRHYEMTWNNMLFGCGGLGYLSSKPYSILAFKLWRYRQFLMLLLIPYFLFMKYIWFNHIMMLALVLFPIGKFCRLYNIYWESLFNTYMDVVTVQDIILLFDTFQDIACELRCVLQAQVDDHMVQESPPSGSAVKPYLFRDTGDIARKVCWDLHLIVLGFASWEKSNENLTSKMRRG